MEGMLLIVIGLVIFLFFRIHFQKNELLSLERQFYNLQQQVIQLQKLIQRQEPLVKPEAESTVEQVNDGIIEDAVEEKPNIDLWQASPDAITASPQQTHESSYQPKQHSADHSSVDHSTATPSALDKGLLYVMGLVKKCFSEGNQIVRIGIVVLFFGMSFLAKYSIENSLVSIEIRMVSILIAALIMLGIGWHLRIKNPAYGLIMQGGGYRDQLHRNIFQF